MNITNSFGPFHVDETNSDDEYLYVDVPSKSLTIVVKLDDEGIVVDVFPQRVADAPVASTWATYAEIQDAADQYEEMAEEE